MKIPPTSNILRFDWRYNNKFRRKIRMKKEHGLKLSNPPNTIVNTGRERLVRFTGPIHGR
jgi:hypothetical protein